MRKAIIFIMLFFVLSGMGAFHKRQFTAPGIVYDPCPGTQCVGSKIGCHAIFYIGFTQLQKRKIIQAASAAHCGTIRMPVTWVDIQPTNGAAYDWTGLDYMVDQAKQWNLAILFTLAEIPPWASSASGCPSSCPSDARFYAPASSFWTGSNSWQAFVQAIVARYGITGNNKVKLWEIGAEANLNSQWKSSAADFAHLFALGYDAIKASDAGATVGMGSMQEVGQPTWMNAVLTDATYPASGRIDVIDVDIRGSVATVQALKQAWVDAFAAQGITGKPFWITEHGFPTNLTYQGSWDPAYVGVDADDARYKQGQYYKQTIPWFMANGVDKLFITLDDIPCCCTCGFDSEGIIDNAYSIAKSPGFSTIAGFADYYH